MHRFLWILTGIVGYAGISPALAYQLSDHPRIFVNKPQLKQLAEQSQGVLSREYALIKAEADRAMSSGIQRSGNRFRTPVNQICLGITYLVERQRGRDSHAYAEAIKAFWADGRVLSLDGSGHFGYHAMVYDWIYDADAIRFLDSWAKRVPEDCIPAFDEMGGVWSESMGHGNYGPIAVIP